MANSSSDSDRPLVENMDVELYTSSSMPTDLGQDGFLYSDPENEFDHGRAAEVTDKQKDDRATGGDVELDDVIDGGRIFVGNHEATTDKERVDKLLKKIKNYLTKKNLTKNENREEFFEKWRQSTSLKLSENGEYREGTDGEYEIEYILQKKEDSLKSQCSVSVIKDLATEHLLIMKTFPEEDKLLCCLNEVEALCKLDIEGFRYSPKLLAVQTDRGKVIVYMELLKGCTLRPLKGAMRPEWKLPVALYIFTILKKLIVIINNDHELYHLDLHHANVFFVKSESYNIPWITFIIDFGGAMTLTRLGQQNKCEELFRLQSEDKLNTLVLFGELCGVSINIYDLENDWEARVDKCQELDETKKRHIKEIIEKGVPTKKQPAVEEIKYIDFLNSELDKVLANETFVDLEIGNRTFFSWEKIKTAFENVLRELEKEREEKQKASPPKSANNTPSTGTPKETSMVPTSGVPPAQTLPSSEMSNLQTIQKLASLTLESAPNQTSELSLSPLPAASSGIQDSKSNDEEYNDDDVSEFAQIDKADAKELSESIDKMSPDADRYQPSLPVSESEADAKK